MWKEKFYLTSTNIRFFILQSSYLHQEVKQKDPSSVYTKKSETRRCKVVPGWSVSVSIPNIDFFDISKVKHFWHVWLLLWRMFCFVSEFLFSKARRETQVDAEDFSSLCEASARSCWRRTVDRWRMERPFRSPTSTDFSCWSMKMLLFAGLFQLSSAGRSTWTKEIRDVNEPNEPSRALINFCRNCFSYARLRRDAFD